ncbi:uncharacterized protein LOC119103145 [Pollicipes pollicipes]|uniref:uncharacterized protein LOC119103145 n=1 Tax=Pollicipes pollicipes TaxID=41117 RepID=UPI0018855067|nr:uncharacterized protein LOC119103145 [Pollicipes pollicipes]
MEERRSISSLFSSRRKSSARPTPTLVVSDELQQESAASGHSAGPDASRNGSVLGSPTLARPDTRHGQPAGKDGGKEPGPENRCMKLRKIIFSKRTSKVLCGLIITACITLSWVGAIHFIKMTYYGGEVPQLPNSTNDIFRVLHQAGGIVDAFVVHVSAQTGDVFVQLDTADAHEASVLFVDYGKRRWCRSRSCARCRPTLRHPAQALTVRLSGVQMTDGAALRLTEMVPRDGTRVVLRVTSNPAAGVPEVEAYKRLENNELVSINATLAVEAHMSSRADRVSRQSSTASGRRRRRPSLASPRRLAAGGRLLLQPVEQYRVQRDGDGYLDVTVSFCSSPWNIYVQPYLEGGKLRALMHAMQEHYSQPVNVQPLRPDAVAGGQFCAVKNPEDELWYSVRSRNQESCALSRSNMSARRTKSSDRGKL